MFCNSLDEKKTYNGVAGLGSSSSDGMKCCEQQNASVSMVWPWMSIAALPAYNATPQQV